MFHGTNLTLNSDMDQEIFKDHSISNRPTLLLIKIGRFFFYEINLQQETLRPYV